MKAVKLVLLIIISATILDGCKKSDQFSDVPSITFKSLTVMKSPGSLYDSIADLVISFTDGDGDIGATQYSGTTSSFVSARFKKHNGVWAADTTAGATLGENLPYLTPTGNNKALKGDIDHSFLLPFAVTKDTVRYDIYISDRAKHKSNVLTTPEIVITTY